MPARGSKLYFTPLSHAAENPDQHRAWFNSALEQQNSLLLGCFCPFILVGHTVVVVLLWRDYLDEYPDLHLWLPIQTHVNVSLIGVDISLIETLAEPLRHEKLSYFF